MDIKVFPNLSRKTLQITRCSISTFNTTHISPRTLSKPRNPHTSQLRPLRSSIATAILATRVLCLSLEPAGSRARRSNHRGFTNACQHATTKEHQRHINSHCAPTNALNTLYFQTQQLSKHTVLNPLLLSTLKTTTHALHPRRRTRRAAANIQPAAMNLLYARTRHHSVNSPAGHHQQHPSVVMTRKEQQEQKEEERAHGADTQTTAAHTQRTFNQLQ
jgi:hypothetical protein